MTVDAVPDVDELLAQSVQILRSCLTSDDVPVSVFVDPTLANTLCEAEPVKMALTQGALVRIVLPIAHEDFAPDARPYLLHAPSEQKAERAIEHTLRTALSEAMGAPSPFAASRQVCAWIVGEADPKMLADRLAKAAITRKPDGEPRPFRYWDPRVMWHLPRVLEPSRWGALIAALGAWLSLDMQHRLGPVAASKLGDASPAPKGHQEVPVRCSPEQWAALARIGPTNMALAQAQDWGVLPTLDAARQVDSLLRACEALGFESQRDAQVFVACGLTSHAKFFELDEVRLALVRAQAAGQSVMSALGQFDDSFWDDLRQQQAQPRTHIQ